MNRAREQCLGESIFYHQVNIGMKAIQQSLGKYFKVQRFFQDAARTLEDYPSRFGQRCLASFNLEDGHTKLTLKFGDGIADCRLAQIQTFSCFRKTTAVVDSVKDPQLFERNMKISLVVCPPRKRLPFWLCIAARFTLQPRILNYSHVSPL